MKALKNSIYILNFNLNVFLYLFYTVLVIVYIINCFMPLYWLELLSLAFLHSNTTLYLTKCTRLVSASVVIWLRYKVLCQKIISWFPCALKVIEARNLSSVMYRIRNPIAVQNTFSLIIVRNKINHFIIIYLFIIICLSPLATSVAFDITVYKYVDTEP